MSWRARLALLLPHPRRPWRWTDAVPLVVACCAIAGLLTTLALDGLRLAAPERLVLLLILPLIWWWWAATGPTGLRPQLAAIVRLLLFAALITALAEPRSVRISDRLSVVYCLDRSSSLGTKVQDEALRWVLQTAGGKPAQDEAGLVIFARDAAVELPPRAAFPFETLNSRLDPEGTDLGRALELSAAVLPEGNPGRVVLISDGTATEGSTDRALALLRRRQIPVDVLPIRYDHQREVWVERLDLPTEVRPGETYDAVAILGALTTGEGTLVLRENGVELTRSPVAWQAGRTRLAVPIRLRGAGYWEYAATIEPVDGQDGWRQNNTAINFLWLRGQGRVLLVRAQGSTVDGAADLAKALIDTGRAVEVIEPWQLPDAALPLLPYDSVALLDVPAEQVSAAQQAALRDAVRDLGTGLLMAGGAGSFGPGGWNRTAVEEALPVTMDISNRKVLPKGALAIVLHTCEFPEGNTWGKRITKQAMKVLAPQDDIGVLCYDYTGGGEKWLIPLTPAAEYDRLAPIVTGAEIGDMPSFQNILTLAVQGLIANDAAAKHCIVISDGDPSPPTPALLQQAMQAGITISTVSVFPHDNKPSDSMQQIARATGGRHYYPDDPARLPAIFTKEAQTIRRSQIQNKEFTPTPAVPSSIMKGLGALPALHGYVLTNPRPRSQTVLEGPDVDEADPVLATWRFGVGTGMVFTADLGRGFGRDWVAWGRYRAFADQLFTALARATGDSHLTIRCAADGRHGTIQVEDHLVGGAALAAQAMVTVPGGTRLPVELRAVAPGRYSGEFPLAGAGRYQVAVAAAGDQRSEQALGGLVVSYPEEFRRFRANPAALERLAEATGGRVLSGAEDGKILFGADRQPRASTRPVFDLLLAVLAALLVLDVALRRLQPDWHRLTGWLRRRRANGPATPTMAALLAAKTAVAGSRGRAVAGSTPDRIPPAGSTSVASAPAPTTGRPDDRTTGPVSSPQSTAARLLDAKRRRQDKDSKP